MERTLACEEEIWKTTFYLRSRVLHARGKTWLVNKVRESMIYSDAFDSIVTESHPIHPGADFLLSGFSDQFEQ